MSQSQFVHNCMASSLPRLLARRTKLGCSESAALMSGRTVAEGVLKTHAAALNLWQIATAVCGKHWEFLESFPWRTNPWIARADTCDGQYLELGPSVVEEDHNQAGGGGTDASTCSRPEGCSVEPPCPCNFCTQISRVAHGMHKAQANAKA